VGILKDYIDPKIGAEFKDPATGNLKLKSLKFGNDNSFTAEPFIQTPIPSDTEVVTKPKTSLAAYGDGVIRGSLISIQRSATDVLRLTKYMASPSGIQFTLKQNLLSRVSPETEASGKFLNEGVYTPLSTLAQAGVGILGIHLNKQGLLPTSLKKYGEVVYKLGQDNPNTKVTNRLVNLHFESIENPDSFSLETLYKYKGGPGSVLGLGKTYIQYATKGDGVTPQRLMGSNGLNPKSYMVPLKTSIVETRSIKGGVGLANKDPNPQFTTSLSKANNLPNLTIYDDASVKERNLLVSGSYHSFINDQLINAGSGREITDKITYGSNTSFSDVSPRISQYIEYSSFNTIQVDPASSDASPSTKYVTLNQGNRGYLANLNKNVGWYLKNPNDPKSELVYDSQVFNGVAKNVGPDFRKVDRNVRGFVDYPDAYDHITKTSGDVIKDGDYFTDDQATKVVDRIYYTSDAKRTSNSFSPDHDLINFSIEIISPTESSKTLRFRAYIDNFSDSYNPEWNSQTYMGRGEKFYKYNSFDRKISLGFTVAAEGEHHLGDMYGHLNTLASSLAPTYTTSGYMAGNLHRLTVGNYVADQYGIITGMTYDIIEESPWDIKSGKQLPMYIKVTGFQFTPIHNFRPEYGASGKFINQPYIKEPLKPTEKPNTSGTTDSGLKPVIFK
jgi:hypothetical protein